MGPVPGVIGLLTMDLIFGAGRSVFFWTEQVQFEVNFSGKPHSFAVMAVEQATWLRTATAPGTLITMGENNVARAIHEITLDEPEFSQDDMRLTLIFMNSIVVLASPFSTRRRTLRLSCESVSPEPELPITPGPTALNPVV